MLRVYSVADKDIWNKIVKSFSNWDIYYLCEYALSFKIHGDGDVFLIYFEYKMIDFVMLLCKRILLIVSCLEES